jgi:DNA invertase Pin-like site-specific DNA recombinase
VSGWKDKSKLSLEKVLELVRSQSCDEVIITRLDRLSRKGVRSFAIFEDFLQSGVTLRALDEPFDLTTASGRMMAGQLVVFAQFYSDQKAESVRHGWKHLRDRKVAMNPPFGYIKTNDHFKLDHRPFLCLLENKEIKTRAQVAREIVDAYLQQQSLRMALRVINEHYGIQVFAHNNQDGQKLGGRVARDMFRFSSAGLSEWLTNPVLQGHTCYLRKKQGKHVSKSDWLIHYDTHSDQRLITDEEVRQIEQIRQHNQRVRGYGSTALKYPLSGLVFCAKCRSACYSLKGSRGKNQPGYNYYFQCKNWWTRACTNKKVCRMEVVEQAVISEAPPSEPLELQQLRSQLATLEAMQSNNSAIIEARLDLKRQIKNFRHMLAQKSEVRQENQELLMKTFGVRLYWQTLPDEEKRLIYRALVSRLTVKDGLVAEVILSSNL